MKKNIVLAYYTQALLCIILCWLCHIRLFGQTTCSLGDPVFIENFGSGSNRLGPSLNQNPNTNVHPDFRPADLYTYIGSGAVGQDQYGIMKNAKDASPDGAFWNDSFTDHTGNVDGYFYYCDAKEDLNVFYAQKIEGLCSDIEYELSAWFAKTNAPDYFIDPNIKLIIGFTNSADQNIGNIVEIDTGPIEGVGDNRWHRKSLVFSMPMGTENVYFMLKNNVAGLNGNDLAIDDIEVRPCGPEIVITNQETNSVIGENEPICFIDANATFVSLSTNTPAGYVQQWQESIGNGIWKDIVGETSNTINYTLPLSSTPEYLIRLKFATNSGNLTNDKCYFLSQEVSSSLVTLVTPNNIRVCDNLGNNDGVERFDLESLSPIILNGQSSIDNKVSYYLSQADAIAEINSLSSPHENSLSPFLQTIYTKVENLKSGCSSAIVSFNLEVYKEAFPLNSTAITPIIECDDISVGSYHDGFKVFDITQREEEILNEQSNTEFSLTYFTDITYQNQIITPSSFVNTIKGGQTIYVRMTNNLFADCFNDTNFRIEVNEIPIANTPGKYAQCDDQSNDGQALFNLTLNSIKEEISPNYLSNAITFTYYKSEIEAENAGVEISNPQSYQDNLGFTMETVWVRVENINGCFRVVPLDLEVNPSSAALEFYNPNSIYQCDDGIDNRDGVSTFDLTEIRDDITNTIFSGISVSVHFYENQIDAELEINEITNTNVYENVNSKHSQDIWVRVKSDLGNDCLGLKRFQDLLIVEAIPIANPVVLVAQCDFDMSDTVLSYPFDVSQLETMLLKGQDPADITISYFDANDNPLLYIDGTLVISPIQAVFLTQPQTITIRVSNKNSQDPDGLCFDETTLEFIVDEQPVANPVLPQIVCDGDIGDIDNDGIFPFDTSTFTSTILGSQGGMEVYYNYMDENGNSVMGATSLPNPLISKNQSIMVEVINPINTSCTATTAIDLVVNSLPDFTIETPRIICSSNPEFNITLDPTETNSTDTFTYEWVLKDDTNEKGTIISNASVLTNVSAPGTYSVTLTKTDGTECSRTIDVFVGTSELANITQEDVVIVEMSDSNSVTINPLENGIYEYALRKEDAPFIVYQEEAFFNNVEAGFYTLYVKDKICGVVTLDISVMGYPKFFTPNGDSYNDYWKIEGVEVKNQHNSTVFIYDRYGKLLKQLLIASEGWDGTYNGRMMPAGDYWFKVFLQDRTFMNHFTLKR